MEAKLNEVPWELFVILPEHTLSVGIKSVFKKPHQLGWEKETNYGFDTTVFQGVWLKGLTILLRWLKLTSTVFHHSTNSSCYLLNWIIEHVMIVLNELVTKSSESYLNICCENFLNIWTNTSDCLVKEVAFLCVTIFLWIEINSFSLPFHLSQNYLFHPFLKIAMCYMRGWGLKQCIGIQISCGENAFSCVSYYLDSIQFIILHDTDLTNSISRFFTCFCFSKRLAKFLS